MTTESYAVLDVETTTGYNANPYASSNRLCYIGLRLGNDNFIYPIEYGEEPYGGLLEEVRSRLARVHVVVGFNLKFDLAWLRRYGVSLDDKTLWDCQLCEFLTSNQQQQYPSLGNTLQKYGLPAKSTYIEDTYWSQGIDTPEIPRRDLEEYLSNDLVITDALYNYQREHFPASKRTLFGLQCRDLKTLLDMETNGLLFDFMGMEKARERLAHRLNEIEQELGKYVDHWPHFNFDSGDHLSCLLYGGTVSVDVATPYDHTYKTGQKAGTTEVRNRWETVTKTFPRLIKPLPRTELKKEGYWSTEESVIRKLHKQKHLRDLLLERSKIEKMVSTYLVGIPAHVYKYGWDDGYIHGTFNQCTVITGRLSSEKPNQQNFPKELDEFIITRF